VFTSVKSLIASRLLIASRVSPDKARGHLHSMSRCRGNCITS